MSAFPDTNANGEVENITVRNHISNRAQWVTIPFVQTPAQIASNQGIRTDHLVPANTSFETGVKDGAIVCGDIKQVKDGKLLQLLAKYETVDILEMLVQAHLAGPSDTFEVMQVAGLSTRITSAFKWAAEQAGLSVEGMRAEFNIAARANGRTESVDYRVPQASRAVHAAAARFRVTAATAARDQAVTATMGNMLFDLVDQN